MAISLQKLASEAAKAKPSIKRLIDLAEDCAAEFGGSKGLAQKMLATFEQGNDTVKAKMLELNAKLQMAAIRARGDEVDLADLSDQQLADLERELASGEA